MIELSLRHRPLVLFLTLVLIGVGVYSMGRLPIDAVPDVTNVQVQINANAPSLSPLEVERLITIPVEQAFAGLPDVEQVRSLSMNGLSQVTVVLHDGVDLYFARQLIFQRLQEARENIPEGLGEPEMGPVSTGLGEIYQYVVKGKGKSLMELRDVQDWIAARQLRSVPGVTEINDFGGQEMQFQVRVDPVRLQAYRLTLQDVSRALAANNLNAGAGYLEVRDERVVLRGLALLQDQDDLRRIVLKEENGVPVLLGQVARVERGPALRYGAVTRDGKGEVVTGIVMMLVGENSRTVSGRVDRKVAEINASLPEGVELETYYDRTDMVNRTIATVSRNLVEGAVLVVLVLFLALNNFRAALIVALAIPLSMLFAVSLMVKAGISGNLMSLGAIDFGLIVDGSVVMVENTLRRLSQGPPQGVRALVARAAREVGQPIVFGVGIITVVYLPILTLNGMEGKTFRPMAWTVVFALAGSLLLALTLVPVLCSFLLRPSTGEKDPVVVRSARRLYAPILRAALAVPGPLSLGGLAFFALSLLLFTRLGAEFLPQLDEGAIAVQINRLPSVSLGQSLEMAGQVERALKEFPEVETVVTRTGRPGIATDPMGVELSDVIVMLRPRSEWRRRSKEALVEAMDRRLERIPGMQYSFSQPIQLRVSELIAGVRSDVALKIVGEDMAVLRETAERAAARLKEIPGARDVRVEQVSGTPYLQVVVDRAALARYGLSAVEVLETVQLAAGQMPAGVMVQGERRYDLVVRLDRDLSEHPEQLGDLRVAAPTGALVPLKELARLEHTSGVARVSREDGQRFITVEANVRGRDLVGFVNEARGAVAGLIPAGYFTRWGGQFENFERARARLMVVVPVALASIVFLLYLSLGSLRQAALIFLNVPFAVTGGVLALAVRGLPFSISAGVGFIALFGVAVLNGLVLITCINQLRGQGASVEEAVVEGALTRLRPVLMTALVAGLGFVPMALSQGAGAEVQRPLATVVIGGLITSTALTLIVLPSFYRWLEGSRRVA
ncbi:MAG: CusA/CzcA family heavy metal efflux RND transporter [Candidatus Eremiobacterota bacterium]